MRDDELAALALAGDDSAFAALVRLHQGALRGFLLRMTRGDHALADDLAQEAFLEAWRKIAQFRASGSFSGWLTRIAWSRFLMTARKRKLELLEDADVPLAAEADSDMRLDLERAMTRLSGAERAAITLCDTLGHSHEEAAAILTMPLGTVNSHILRGHAKLRTLLYGAKP